VPLPTRVGCNLQRNLLDNKGAISLPLPLFRRGCSLAPGLLYHSILGDHVKMSRAVQQSQRRALLGGIPPKLDPVDHVPLGSVELAPIKVSDTHADRECFCERHDLRVIRFFAARLDFLPAKLLGGEWEEGLRGEQEWGEQVGVGADVRRGDEPECLRLAPRSTGQRGDTKGGLGVVVGVRDIPRRCNWTVRGPGAIGSNSIR
jgi:hypothetical protein